MTFPMGIHDKFKKIDFTECKPCVVTVHSCIALFLAEIQKRNHDIILGYAAILSSITYKLNWPKYTCKELVSAMCRVCEAQQKKVTKGCFAAFMFAMRSISPVLGYVLGAWTTTLYVNLTGKERSRKLQVYGPLARYVKLRVRMRREWRERFPRLRG